MDSNELETRSYPAPGPAGGHDPASGRSILSAVRSAIDPLLRGLPRPFRSGRPGEPSDRVDRVVPHDVPLRLDPVSIEFCAKTEFSFSYYQGAVQPGDWDQSSKRFDRLDIYHAFREVCREGTTSWQDTSFYESTLAAIESGQRLWGCGDRTDLDARCAGLTRLYETIATDGYKSQAELGSNELDEVSVAIGRTGEVLFSDGAHRLCIARLLDIPDIPVVVTVRHPEWVAFKSQLTQYIDAQPSRSLRRQAAHPDLVSLSAERSCSDLFEAIAAGLPMTSGRVVDLGSDLGYMCHRFEDMGLDCIASEGDGETVALLTKLREASKKRFEIRSAPFLEDDGLVLEEHDLVIALNAFHPFMGEESGLASLTDFLSRLKARHMILEAPAPGESPKAGAGARLSPEEFVEFVMRQVGLTRSTCLHEAPGGRRTLLLS